MQEINLCTAIKKPGPYTLNAKRAKLFLIFFIVCCTCITLLEISFMVSQQLYLIIIESKEKTIAQQLQSLLQNSSRIATAKNLKDKINLYNQEIASHKQIIQMLTNYNQQKNPFSPSAYLQQLAEAATPSIWLTHINLQQQGQKIDLEGYILSSSELAKFIKRLQQEPLFSQKVFKTIKISNTEKEENLLFSLSTEQ